MRIKSIEDQEGAKFGVHVLVVIFGITSWSIMNGLWVELPILVSHLPEGWTLPSYLTIIAQLGNIGLIIFTLIAYSKPKLKLETPTSFVIVVALTLCALLYAFFWKETAHVAGDDHSVALFALTLTQSVFAATTSIAYVTFMAHLKARYMASIFIGMGFSGLIPAFAALGQGQGNIRCIDTNNTGVALSNRSREVLAGTNSTSMKGSFNNSLMSTNITDTMIAVNEEPQFSVQGFFLLLFSVGLVSMLSFLMLVFHPYCKSEHVDTDKEENCQLMQTTSKPDSENALGTDSLHSTYQVSQTSNDTYITGNSDSGKRTATLISNNRPATLQSLDSISRDGIGGISEDSTSSPLATHHTPQASDSLDSSTTDGDGHPIYAIENVTDIVDSDTVHKVISKNDGEEHVTDTSEGRQITKLESWYLLGLLVWINALQSSFVLAIQVYSSLPYGLQFYHGATKAENIVDPVASFLTFWITARTTRVISGLTLLGTLFTAYIIVVASMSPNPFLVHEAVGGALVVTAWVMCTMIMVFSKVSIASVMRGQGRLSLMWTGASTQLGSMIGAIIAYITINALHLFKDEPWCR